ncbi:hypothetical protein PFLG_02603 [Plasmodium falciparum RAJ116]|uniref:DNAJ-containing protein X-domain domain-containing protein n=1 Tax=Plasmodium falciparum RAJ116 TaxID=580058 RepID=A0A0L0CZE2_PLAFA|nr:hypothetical protein PFLG_02603 [Plasmodium falciparum RAJ116]
MKYFKKFKYFLPKYILTNDDENKNKYASHKIYNLNNKYGNFLKLIICLPFILITVLWIFLTISIFNDCTYDPTLACIVPLDSIYLDHLSESFNLLSGLEGEELSMKLGDIICDALRLMLWDIESTVKDVAKRVLRDKAVRKKIRLKRAEAMLILGNLMLEISGISGIDFIHYKVDGMKIIESALMKSIQFSENPEEN